MITHTPLFYALQDTILACGDGEIKIGVTGWPMSGKTTTVRQIAETPRFRHLHVVHADGFITHHGMRFDDPIHWQEIANLNKQPHLLIEGCAVPRMVEQGLTLKQLIIVHTPVKPHRIHKGLAAAVDRVSNRLSLSKRYVINEIIKIT